ncbi:MAG TPA: hypothetical protein DCZ91_18460, partial [Lachnospiraceae bacterium]|nr:hypothetical protein [Lachnospiraceae bacterium]
MKKWSKMSLIGQLSLFSMGILASLAAAFVITNIYVRSSNRQNILNMNEKILFQIQGKLEDYSRRLNHIAAAMAYSPTTKAYFGQSDLERVISAKDIETVFSNIMLLDEDIAEVSLYDAEMNQIAAAGRETEEAVAGGLVSGFAFGNVGRQEGVAYFTVSYPVYDLESWEYGRQIGMVSLVMKTDGVQGFLADSGATEHTELYLLDSGGTVAASSGTGFQPGEDWKSDGKHLVQVRETAIEGWSVVSQIPEQELDGGAGSRGLVIAAYGIAVLLIGMLVYFFYANFIRRIYQMDQFIRDVVHTPGKRMEEGRSDEIGRVIGSLNRMLDERERMDAEIQDSQKRMYEIELAEKQLQILAYRNQINPHFLYNTFECIRGMALYHNMEEIAEITMALSKVFRYAVKEANLVTVRDEIDYIKEYATIIEYRFMGKIEVDIDADESLLHYNVIRLMLQPVVENAVFHGLEQKMGDGEVTVTVRRKWEHCTKPLRG